MCFVPGPGWKHLDLEQYRISGLTIVVNPKRVQAILDWTPHESVKQVRSFLGLASYCHRFVGNFSKVAKPLTELLKKDKKFQWTPKCEESFQELKRRLTSAPYLHLQTPKGISRSNVMLHGKG